MDLTRNQWPTIRGDKAVITFADAHAINQGVEVRKTGSEELPLKECPLYFYNTAKVSHETLTQPTFDSTGDVVNSSSVATRDWLPALKNTLNSFGGNPGEWAIYRGGSFQLLLNHPQKAMLAVLTIKVGILAQSDHRFWNISII